MTSTYLGDSGIVLAGSGDETPDGAGVKWTISGEGPFSRSPSPREISGDNATEHGAWDATKFYGPRVFNLTGKAYAPDHVTLHRAEGRFKKTVGLGVLLRHVEPGFDRQALFRRSGEVLWTELTDTIAQFSASMWAKDPRAYSTAIQSASTTFPATSGGLSWPTQWPARWDGVSTSGEMLMINDGNETAWPIYRIDGPVQDPVIVNADTGQAMRFTITLGAGEWLTVNTRTHAVLGNGDPNASRRVTFHGDWFGLEPGPNTVRFTGASGVGSTLSATWHHTDI